MYNTQLQLIKSDSKMIKKHLKTPLLLKQYFRKILKKNKYSFLKLLYQVKDYLFIKKIEKSD